jgi:hypothetical protein
VAAALALAACLVVAVWLALFNLAVSGLVISNTLRGIEPFSVLFAVCMLCVGAYAGVLAIGLARIFGGGTAQGIRWLTSRLAVVDVVFIGIAVLALAVP